jgi:hypothetical protein
MCSLRTLPCRRRIGSPREKLAAGALLDEIGRTLWQAKTDAAGDLFGTTTGASPVTGAQVTDGTAFELSGAGFAVPVAFAVDDVTTGVQSVQSLSQATPYSGPVYGLVDQYIYTSADSLNVAAGVANTFIHTGSGDDAIDVSHVGGINVLDGGTGSNFLVGGTGPFSFDTFFVGSSWIRVGKIGG